MRTRPRREGAGRPTARGLVAGLGLALVGVVVSPAAQAGPFEACLADAAPAGARAAAIACREAELILALAGRDTKRSNVANNPSLPPAVRANRTRLADLSLAKARHLVDLGDVAGARRALARARDVNPGVRGQERVVVMLERGSIPLPVGAGATPPAPPAAAAAAPGEAATFAYTVLFDRGSAALREDGRRLLDAVAAVMARDPGLATRLAIEGHADTSGSEARNLELSLRRARAVALHLVEAHGLRADRLAVAGLGEAEPLPGMPGTDPRNRRVEVTGLAPTAPGPTAAR